MLNKIVMVGRIVESPTLEQEGEKKFTRINLSIPRSFKNAEGEYETDIIPVMLWETVAQNTCEYCQKGDLVGVKGRIQSNNDKINVIAEKITFLASKKHEED